MNQNLSNSSLYGQSFLCECGQHHRIQPDQVIYGDDAIAHLPAALAAAASSLGGKRVAVLTDERTRDVAGLAALEVLRDAGWSAKEFMLRDPSPGHSPACDEPTRAKLNSDVGQADAIVPVGSGVLSDLGKLLADGRGVWSVCLATAASMNGYASANVALTVSGLKTLVRSKPAAAVLAVPKVIADAPYELTTAGLGDVLAKSVSSADWRLGHLLFGDYYCPRSVGLIGQIEPLYLEHPQDILQRRPVALAALFEALLLTGVAMTMAQTSSPASGAEHMISHTLDMRSYVEGAKHDLHGRQVGVGTVLAAELYRRVLAQDRPDWRAGPSGIDEAFWGPLAAPAAKEYQAKAERLADALAKLRTGQTWQRLRSELSPMLRRPEDIRRCLAGAKAAVTAADLGFSKDQLRAAILHAHEFRSRFTILDVARMAGVLPKAAGEIVEQWA